MNSNTKYLFVLLILPLLFLFFGNNFHRTHYAGDPDYIYLMNAISLSRGVDAGHIDNPGTTVMELGACLLWIHYFMEGSDKDTLQYAVLKEPDKYVNLIRQAFILLIAFAMIISGWIVYSKTRNLWSALIFQITPFLSVNVLEHAWTKVSPEPVLLFITTLYAAVLVVYYYDTKQRSRFYIMLFSLMGGFGLATKATFLPVLVIPFFLLANWKRSLIYLFGVVAIFFLFTLPAHAEYHRMFDWFIGILTHKGIYGGGEKGFIDIPLYLQNLNQIIVNNLFFSFVLLISIVSIFLVYFHSKISRSQKGAENKPILLALVSANILGILVVAKHYHANHYLLPALALSGVTLFFSFESIKTISNRGNWLKFAQIIFIALFLLVFFIWFIPLLQVKNQGYKETNKEYVEVNEIMKCNYAEFRKVYHYPDGLNKLSALKFGNGYSKLTNQKALTKLYPNAFFYNVMSGQFQLWEKDVSEKDVFDNLGQEVIITGRPIKPEDLAALKKSGIDLKNIYQGKFQALYEVDSIKRTPIQY
jgi:hypothetical protein